MFHRLHVFELHQAGTCDTADGFTRGVGDEVEMISLHGRRQKETKDDVWMMGITAPLRTAPLLTGSPDPIFAPNPRHMERSFPDL